MLKPGNIEPQGLGAFSIFAVLGGLTFLMVSNHVAPGCTGPEVRRCDYVIAAKAAMTASNDALALIHPFSRDRGFEVFDQGSSVLVQQADPFGPGWLSHASSVRVDKKSCQPCAIEYAQSAPFFPDDADRGPMILQVPAEDPAAAAKLSARIRAIEANWR